MNNVPTEIPKIITLTQDLLAYDNYILLNGSEITKVDDDRILVINKYGSRSTEMTYDRSKYNEVVDLIWDKVVAHFKKQIMPILKVDFDGTIVKEKFPYVGDPIPMALDVIKKFHDHGYNTILWTCREGEHLQDAIVFLESHGIFFDVVNTNHHNNPYRHLSPPRKPFANYHIDDKNIGGLLSWQQIHDYFFVDKKYHELIQEIK